MQHDLERSSRFSGLARCSESGRGPPLRRLLLDGGHHALLALERALTAPRDVSSKALKVTWSKDRVSATVDQSAKTMGLKLALPPKGWALELSSPWDSPGAASLKIGGKVDTGSLL